jgi:hypothetical protein
MTDQQRPERPEIRYRKPRPQIDLVCEVLLEQHVWSAHRGLLGFPLAGYVLTFYANLKQLQHVAACMEGPVRLNDQRAVMKLIEDACRQNA